MKYIKLLLATSVVIFTLFGCTPKDDSKTVTFYGWGGDEKVNAWLDGYVKTELKKRYDIDFVRVSMNPDDMLVKLMNEKQANKSDGDIDIIWINGENFAMARQQELLKQIDIESLESYSYIEADKEFLKYDFGTEIDNYEVPFGLSQFVYIGNNDKLKTMPANTNELLDVLKANPGCFTYPAPPDFTGSAFVRNVTYDIVGYDKINNTANDKEELRKVMRPVFEYLNDIEPYLWQEGETYPQEENDIQQMYADEILYMSMSYTTLIAPRNINDKVFPKSSTTFVFNNGNISNTHYLATPFNSSNNDSVIKVLDFLLSPDAQISKFDISNWGDLPVISQTLLSDKDKKNYEQVNSSLENIDVEKLSDNSKSELDAEKIVIIEQLWEEEVLFK